MKEYQYKAFISYSHKDRKWTRWLHRRLETYPIPKNIIGNVTPAGTIPRRLKPIFRDREELSASNNLGEKIEAALASSKNLIIICSPAAAQSKWVNQEILTFKQNNRDAQLFSVIVEGEPYASTMPGREDEECFPPALRFEVNSDGTLSDTPAEPLAADLRPHADGKRLGFLKLISGMIGVGLDEVVQRDMKRSRKRVTAITTGSLATVLAMGTLTGFALNSQKEAETQRGIAQARTTSAEELIEFMVTDLKDKLESVGRLDALQVVGEKAATYYDRYDLREHDDDALGRRARVFHYLGEIQASLGYVDEAEKYFLKAYQATENLLMRNPSDADQLFNHAQSAYWVGHVAYKRKDLHSAEEYFQLYLKLATALEKNDPHNSRSKVEFISASTNLGILHSEHGRYSESIKIYSTLVSIYEHLISVEPDNLSYQEDFENLYGWLANAARKSGKIEAALSFREKQESISQKLKVLRPDNQKYRYNFLTNALAKTRLRRQLGIFSTKHTEIVDKAHADALALNAIEPNNSDWALLVLRFKYELVFCYQNIDLNSEADKLLVEIKVFEDSHPDLAMSYKDELSDLKKLYLGKLTLFYEK